MHRTVLLFLVGLLFGALACEEPPPEETPANVSPRARFFSPVWIQAGTEARFDASESFDPDGTIVAYRFLFGDGSPEEVSAGPELSHVFGTSGTFTVWLTVIDAAGAEDRAAHGLGVTVDPPAPCQAAGDCEHTEFCGEDGLCYRDGPGDACATDAECAGTGTSCHSGVCTETECEADPDCLEGERCRAGRCHLADDPGLDGGSGDAG